MIGHCCLGVCPIHASLTFLRGIAQTRRRYLEPRPSCYVLEWTRGSSFLAQRPFRSTQPPLGVPSQNLGPARLYSLGGGQRSSYLYQLLAGPGTGLLWYSVWPCVVAGCPPDASHQHLAFWYLLFPFARLIDLHRSPRRGGLLGQSRRCPYSGR